MQVRSPPPPPSKWNKWFMSKSRILVEAQHRRLLVKKLQCFQTLIDGVYLRSALRVFTVKEAHAASPPPSLGSQSIRTLCLGYKRMYQKNSSRCHWNRKATLVKASNISGAAGTVQQNMQFFTFMYLRHALSTPEFSYFYSKFVTLMGKFLLRGWLGGGGGGGAAWASFTVISPRVSPLTLGAVGK